MTRRSKIVVGYESRNYGGARNTYAPVGGVSHAKMRRLPLEQVFRAGEHLGLHRVFVPAGLGRNVDLVHLWNRVAISNKPWGVSFEHTLPYLNPSRHEHMIRWQRQRLTADSCRFLVGMSHYAVRELEYLTPSRDWTNLQGKVHHVYPHHTQDERRSDYPSLEPERSLSLIFVGGDFFRKGGEAALRAVEQFGEQLDLRLTVVSRVDGGDYRGTPPDDVDVVKIRDRLKSNERITWHERLSHHEVLAQLEQHHVGLLPTLSDTFGYFVLECMGLGVPTIVSNVQALPEFTGADTGWQIQIPLDNRGVWLGRSPDMELRRRHYHEAIESATAQLGTILTSVRSNHTLLDQLSDSAALRYRTQFSPDTRAATLYDIYQGALE